MKYPPLLPLERGRGGRGKGGREGGREEGERKEGRGGERRRAIIFYSDHMI